MDRILPRGRPWSRSADDAVRRATGGQVRILTDADTPALAALAARDPVANCFIESMLERGRRAGPRGSTEALLLGLTRDLPPVLDDGPSPETHRRAWAALARRAGGERVLLREQTMADRSDPPAASRLTAACWAGSNVVPVGADGHTGALFGRALVALRRRFASVYGPREAVTGIWTELSSGHQRAREIREEQPLMTLEGPPAVKAHPEVRPARPDEFSTLLPASAAMFEEELGFSPLQNGSVQYRLRLEDLIRRGRALVLTAEDGSIRFKADLGVVSRSCTQIQGVWVDPAERGRGLSVPGVAAVAEYALGVAPRVSLYVNGYNTAAVRAYRRVGFAQVGSFATVLL